LRNVRHRNLGSRVFVQRGEKHHAARWKVISSQDHFSRSKSNPSDSHTPRGDALEAPIYVNRDGAD
jgi:hypothetical protein